MGRECPPTCLRPCLTSSNASMPPTTAWFTATAWVCILRGACSLRRAAISSRRMQLAAGPASHSGCPYSRSRMPSKILLVDDDKTLLSFLGEYLQNEEYSVLAAGSGAEALRAVYRERPDLVVLDVMMPGMDGWELVARLR